MTTSGLSIDNCYWIAFNISFRILLVGAFDSVHHMYAGFPEGGGWGWVGGGGGWGVTIKKKCYISVESNQPIFFFLLLFYGQYFDFYCCLLSSESISICVEWK